MSFDPHSSSQKQKKKKKKKMSSGQSISAVCVIDSLPDAVLSYILSFLPTKDAAVTSVLSKRWKPLWLSLFTFDFDDDGFPDFRTFHSFVDSVLFSRDSIRSLRLKCGISYRFDRLNISIFPCVAALKGIENLHLHFYFKIPMPASVFSCRTLVVLKLQNLILGRFGRVDFPLLKSLHLDDALFESRGHVTNFLCGCPNLEDLQAKTLHIMVDPKEAEVVEVKSLNKLFKVYISESYIPFHVLIGHVPNLRKEAEVVEVKSLNKLARVNISESYIPFDVLCDAEFFSARLDFGHCVYNPRFHNLTHMELIFEAMGCHVKWKWLVEVLQNCPKLQNLTIHEVSACVNEVGDVHWKESRIVPECLSSQLRTFTLRYFKGTECEVRFAKYILQNSKVLCSMIVHSTCLDRDLKHQMLNNFSVCPRGSATCNLLFD